MFHKATAARTDGVHDRNGPLRQAFLSMTEWRRWAAGEDDEMAEKQSKGREMNGASPGGKPDASTSEEAVKRTGLKARKAAGPDGPDATVVGDTFKKAPGAS